MEGVSQERFLGDMPVLSGTLAIKAPTIDTLGAPPTVGLYALEPTFHERGLAHATPPDEHHDVSTACVSPSHVEQPYFLLATEKLRINLWQLSKVDSHLFLRCYNHPGFQELDEIGTGQGVSGR
ncbi:MAG TPA: hypothetical protein VMW72_03085 [Sedimentisphaerales bacterium]|nr:hypothetical protein [Sedimentisphaerales bacterium]